MLSPEWWVCSISPSASVRSAVVSISQEPLLSFRESSHLFRSRSSLLLPSCTHNLIAACASWLKSVFTNKNHIYSCSGLFWFYCRGLKGTGTRDYNYVQEVWFDRAWLGESPADIHNFFHWINLYWINYFLAISREKLLNLRKAFQNRRVQILCSYWITDFLELCRELLKAGQSQLADFESRPEPTRQVWMPARANSPILKARQSHLVGFQKLFANSKAFCTKLQRISSFNIKLKGQLNNF